MSICTRFNRCSNANIRFLAYRHTLLPLLKPHPLPIGGPPVVIGGTDRYTISPPFGVDLVVAIGTNTPLFANQRPELENAVLYRQALDNALSSHSASPDFKGEFSYFFIVTSP